MITLITGTPGAGKTAWTVQELTRLPAQRKVYVHGIPQLKIAHEPIYCLSELCDHCREHTVIGEAGVYLKSDFETVTIDQEGNTVMPPHVYLVEEWPVWATDGSLIVVDEVQRIWRPINSASALPEEVAALETHRHKGLDFWLISQGPHLFHSNVRLLVGRHIHLVANWRGRSEYEWPECRQNVTSRSDAVIRPYKLPKQIFGMYKSASLHTKLNKRKPLSFYVLCFCALVLSVIGYRIYNRINEFTDSGQVNQPAVSGHSPSAGATSATATQGAGAGGASAVRRVSSPPDFTPAVPGRPETAPAYAHLLKVTSVPVLAGCIASKTSCKCYTHQATPYPVTWEQCQEHVANLKFNPYAQSSDSSPKRNETPPVPSNITSQSVGLPILQDPQS
ncbi:zonular occludens toxin domain-containing protein [Methylomonas rivi]|uniref:Zonular occludens toxin domain-containing protein n=1 Tax=Methylomonas rivi TaxID=2952226 RepID=A0ABT1U9D0_9GAMM|nr:zonular occludens toxin domain-containing protein [Methylomonas sp. WSC-6]MCQ8130463.1 zonular occludens toxin domain-containing protein [Methylomonas sp. WSC-6]